MYKITQPNLLTTMGCYWLPLKYILKYMVICQNLDQVTDHNILSHLHMANWHIYSVSVSIFTRDTAFMYQIYHNNINDVYILISSSSLSY